VTLSGYKVDSTGSHIYRTTDHGAVWTSIGGNLPDAPINDVVIDPLNTQTLYIATDVGVMYTTDLGSNWSVLGSGFPTNVPCHDLTLHNLTRTLYVWTHGRSAFKVQLGSTLAVPVQLNAGWNMISNPVTRTAGTDSVRQLYPNASYPYVYEFTGSTGYEMRYTMANGTGYWAKFPAGGTNAVVGDPRPADSITVTSGWNLVGSVSYPVETSSIVSIPPGILVSGWYGYSGGYTIVDEIVPGHAYWVKANAVGTLILSSTAPMVK
jgi:hypothetical protein